jgi:hypothetical protein
MEIVFYSRTPLKTKKKRKYASRGGYGDPIVVGAVATILGGDEGWPVEISESERVTAVVKTTAKMTETKIKESNDRAIEKYYAYDSLIEQMFSYSLQKKDSPIYSILKSIHGELKKQDAKIEKFYESIHGMKPIAESVAGKKISISHLAKKYVEYATDTGISEPRQEELFKYFGISQPTWCRAFRSQEFWIEVKVKMDNLWNVYSGVEDKVDRIKHKKRSEKELLAEDMKDKDGTPKTMESFIEDTVQKDGSVKSHDDFLNKVDFVAQENIDKIMSPGELRRINKLTRSELIDEIVKIKPTKKRSDFEKTSDEFLRRSLIALTV